MTTSNVNPTVRGISNAVLDILGINDSVVSTMKRLGKYSELTKLLNQIQQEIEKNEMTISELKTALQSESPLGIAYQKINNQIKQLMHSDTEMKDQSRQAQYQMAKVDSSDVFDIGSNMKELDNYATKMENYFKE